jgi:AraC-like DNA-binding protein
VTIVAPYPVRPERTAIVNDRYTLNPQMRVLWADLGLSPALVLRRAGLPRDLFARGPVSLTPAEYYAMWEAAEAELGQPNLPLLIAENLSVEQFDPPIFAAVCSRDLNLAAERVAAHKRLIGPLRMAVECTATETTLRFVWPDRAPEPPRGMAALEIVFWVALARLATRSAMWPLRATAPRPPEDAAAFERYLGAPIRRGDANTVTFSAADAARPFLTANEPMWSFFEPELRRRLADLDRGASVAERIRAALLELLPAGEASMEGVARELHVSTRTLQRRLKGEGTTFQALLSDVRESLARHYLTSSTMSAGEISFLLGYEDPNSFYRAFRSWTGVTPEGLRSATA